MDGSAATPDEELARAARAGATVHRLGISWAGLQPRAEGPPIPNEDTPWAYRDRIDDFYAAAIARGITPILIPWSAPRWATKYASCWLLDFGCQRIASSSDHHLPPDSAHLDEYQGFVHAVKRRWPRALIEAWNEPNLYWRHPSYTGSMAYAAEPEHFTKIQCAAYYASKAVNSAPVLAAGWAYHAYSEYVGRVYAAGGKDCWDLANVHIYTGSQVKFGQGTGLADIFRQVRDLRVRYADSDPIWVTETGFSTTGEESVDQSTQRDASARLYNRLVSMPDVGAAVFHTLRDRGSNAGTREYGFGFLRGDWSPKPVYCHFVGQAANQPGRCP